MKNIKQLPREKAIGTGLRGRVKAHYDQLIRLFGEPYKGSIDGKVQAEWVLETPVGIATIYDFKSDVEPEVNLDWHIGGVKEAVLGYITGVLYADLK